MSQHGAQMTVNFIDRVKIFVKAGDGGNGCISFRRLKYEPKGGPNGGDGGRGGSVWLEVDAGMRTLLDFRYKRHYSAQRGAHGQGSDKHGESGEDIILHVPPGTLVSSDSGQTLGDLIHPGQRLRVAAGGRGGRGNARFVTPAKKAPAFAEKGEPGEEQTLILELKLLADVGIIGLPNAGKSTLVSKISAAKPEIASYPFTTKTPNLGMVDLGDEGRFIIADIPGLIEGAHAGKGLGHDFLRHIDRSAIIIHLIDLVPVDGTDPVENLKVIEREVELYNPEILKRTIIIVGNKLDIPEAAKNGSALAGFCRDTGRIYFGISAATGSGIKEFLHGLAAAVKANRLAYPELEAPAATLEVVYAGQDKFSVRKEGRLFHVTGPSIERLVKMTDFDNDEAVVFMQFELKRRGVETMLKDAGIQEGDIVKIAGEEFEYHEF